VVADEIEHRIGPRAAAGAAAEWGHHGEKVGAKKKANRSPPLNLTNDLPQRMPSIDRSGELGILAELVGADGFEPPTYAL
jgi:hypothetical protein